MEQWKIILIVLFIALILFAIVLSINNKAAIIRGNAEDSHSEEDIVRKIFNSKRLTLPSDTKTISGGGNVKDWKSYATWDELEGNKIALRKYLEERTRILDNPEIDWSDVWRELSPKFDNDFEWIGIINVNEDKKAYISKMERAVITKSDDSESAIVAEIGPRLLDKYTSMPGCFMFHTHPKDSDPFPSLPDISVSVSLSTRNKFFSSVLFSKYGIFMYSLGREYVEDFIVGNKINMRLYETYRMDLACFTESMRAMGNFSNRDRIEMYRRYRIDMILFPSPLYVADEKLINQGDLHAENLVLYLYDIITNYVKKYKLK